MVGLVVARFRVLWALAGGSAGRWERLQARECGGELGGPGLGGLEAQAGLAAAGRGPGGGVQQPVAQPFGIGFGDLAAEQQALRPDEQVVRDLDEFQPDAVVLKERRVRQIRSACRCGSDPRPVRGRGGGTPRARCPGRPGR